MKNYILLLLLTLSVFGFSQPYDHTPSPTIVHRDINEQIIVRSYNTKLFDLDIDNDGINDMVFRLNSSANGLFIFQLHATRDQGSTKFLSTEGIFNCNTDSYTAIINNKGNSFINENSGTWYGTGLNASTSVFFSNTTCSIGDDFNKKGYQYLGVQFRKDGNTHYAWVHLRVDDYGQPNSYLVLDIASVAYETIPNQGIHAGDDGREVIESIEISSEDNKTEITEDYGTLQLTASVSPSEAEFRTINWSIKEEDRDLATIDSNGKLQALKNGVVTVYAIANDINQKEQIIEITISNQKVHIESMKIVAIDGGDLLVDTDYGTLALGIEYSPSNVDDEFKNIRWSVYDNTFVSLDSITGILQALNNTEEVYITATASDPNGTFESAKITIRNQTERIGQMKLYPQFGAAYIDVDQDTRMIESNPTPIDSGQFEISWKVSDDNLATIVPTDNNDALLTAKNDGIVKVISYWEDPSVSGRVVSDTLDMTISNQVTGLFSSNITTESSLYPNPVVQNSFVTIDREKVINHIEVYSLSGQFIKSSLLKNKTIDLNGLDKGVYIIQLYTSDNSIVTEKLIIK